jgi:magnesium-transporting ATPase (P-type)
MDFTTLASPGEAGASLGGSILRLSGLSYKQLVEIHGSFMYVAWGVAPFFGIFVARYMKSLGHKWYILHLWIFLGVTGLGTLIGFLLIVLYKSPSQPRELHDFLGIFIFVFMMIQILLGFFINYMWKPSRTSVPIHDKIHWWMGRGVFVAGLINIALGLLSYAKRWPVSTSVYVCYILLVICGFLLFFYGDYRDGKKQPVNQRP